MWRSTCVCETRSRTDVYHVYTYTRKKTKKTYIRIHIYVTPTHACDAAHMCAAHMCVWLDYLCMYITYMHMYVYICISFEILTLPCDATHMCAELDHEQMRITYIRICICHYWNAAACVWHGAYVCVARSSVYVYGEAYVRMYVYLFWNIDSYMWRGAHVCD